MAKDKKEFKGISVPDVNRSDLKVLEDNNITLTSFVRTQIKLKADKLRASK